MSKSIRQNLILLGILMGMFIFFALQNSKFILLYNLMSMVRQSLPNIILSAAMTFVIASGAIDLSVGGTMALCAMFYGYLCLWGVNAWLAIPIVVLLGIAIGILNTIIMEKLNIPAIMATLATWIITAGLALAVCKAIPISDPKVKPITALNSIKFWNNKLPLALPIVIVIVLIFLFIEKKTIVGKYAIAIGGNDKAAYFSGINVVRMRMVFFTLCGAMAALAGVWQVARLGSCDPTIGTGMEFNVVAACVLGGVNIKGGEGTVTGALIGTLILTILINGMQMMGMDSFYQQVVTGIVLYLAVVLNSFFNQPISSRKKTLKPLTSG